VVEQKEFRMLNIDKKLAKREAEGKIIRTGIVGVGQMGRGLVSQMVLMKGIMPAIVADHTLDKVIKAFHTAGVRDEDIAVAKTLDEANRYMEQGKYVATENDTFISHANLVEVAIDVTGVPEVGVRIAIDALNNKKHVVMMDVETDVVIGSYLKKLGDKNGARRGHGHTAALDGVSPSCRRRHAHAYDLPDRRPREKCALR